MAFCEQNAITAKNILITQNIITNIKNRKAILISSAGMVSTTFPFLFTGGAK